MKNKIILSIIVICYNNEKYIEKCLNSILKQFNERYELIIVNDGSIDKSLVKIKKICKRQKNIYIYENENYGISVSRNFGIKKAKGKYIAFIDGDDWIITGSLKNITAELSNSDSEVILLNTIKYYEDDNIYEKEILKINDNFVSLDDLAKGKVFGRAWRFIVSRKFILNNNLKFPPKLVYEDEMWVTQILNLTNKILFINIPYYVYRKRSDSITSKMTFNKISDLMKVFKNTYEWAFINEKINNYTRYALFRCLRNIFSSISILNFKQKSYIYNWYSKNKLIINDIFKIRPIIKHLIFFFGLNIGIKIYKRYFREKYPLLKKEVIKCIKEQM